MKKEKTIPIGATDNWLDMINPNKGVFELLVHHKNFSAILLYSLFWSIILLSFYLFFLKGLLKNWTQHLETRNPFIVKIRSYMCAFIFFLFESYVTSVVYLIFCPINLLKETRDLRGTSNFLTLVLFILFFWYCHKKELVDTEIIFENKKTRYFVLITMHASSFLLNILGYESLTFYIVSYELYRVALSIIFKWLLFRFFKFMFSLLNEADNGIIMVFKKESKKKDLFGTNFGVDEVKHENLIDTKDPNGYGPLFLTFVFLSSFLFEEIILFIFK